MSDDLSIPNPSYRNHRAGRYGRPAVRRRQSMDPDTKRLLLFAGGVGSVLLVLIGASVFTGHRSGQIPVVLADPNPIRVKPDNPGGMKIDAAENDVFSGGSNTTNAHLGPVAEAPDPNALKAAEAAPARVHHAVPSVVAPVLPPSEPREGARVAEVPPVPPPSAHARSAEAAPVVPPLPARVPAAEVSRAAVPAHGVDGKAAEEKTADGKAMVDRKIVVQLAAMGSDAEAKAEWERLRGKFRELFEGKQLTISRMEHGGHTFWRVRTGGFADVAQARGFCERLRAKGSGCSVAEF